MPKPNFDDVREFYERFQLLMALGAPAHLTQRKLTERIDFLQEELNEFIHAARDQDFAKQADALIDLVYVAMGTAVMLGLPWQALWDEVQRANLAKVRGPTARGHQVDVTKPPGWVPPQLDRVLWAHGYARAWFETAGVLDEELCLDDPIHLAERGAS